MSECIWKKGFSLTTIWELTARRFEGSAELGRMGNLGGGILNGDSGLVDRTSGVEGLDFRDLGREKKPCKYTILQKEAATTRAYRLVLKDLDVLGWKRSGNFPKLGLPIFFLYWTLDP